MSEQRYLEQIIRRQAQSGLIVLPESCELLHIDPGDKVDIKRVFLMEDGKITSSPDQADPV
jgi:predicted lysophospholipase L1 biosynthesis ABC-type transport system permease subunit